MFAHSVFPSPPLTDLLFPSSFHHLLSHNMALPRTVSNLVTWNFDYRSTTLRFSRIPKFTLNVLNQHGTGGVSRTYFAQGRTICGQLPWSDDSADPPSNSYSINANCSLQTFMEYPSKHYVLTWELAASELPTVSNVSHKSVKNDNRQICFPPSMNYNCRYKSICYLRCNIFIDSCRIRYIRRFCERYVQ